MAVHKQTIFRGPGVTESVLPILEAMAYGSAEMPRKERDAAFAEALLLIGKALKAVVRRGR